MSEWTKTPATTATGEAVPIDPIVPPRHRIKGLSTLVGADGAAIVQWVKTAGEPEPREELLARLLAELPARVPAREGTISPPSAPLSTDLLAVYPLGDPHIGMLAWAAESGADFDLKIVEDLMCAAIRDLVTRGPRAARALLVNLGDALHFDNDAGRTTKGDHTLDVDGRLAKVLMVAMRILVYMIDCLLEHHEFVEADTQIGNHDGHSSIWLAIGLNAYYRNEPRVKIPVDPAVRHYHRFGKVLIGTTHGDKTKADDLGSIMATERPEDWGATTYRAWLCGHVHHQTVKEYRGCKVETFRTLAARDSWHARQGYQSGRDMHRLTIHREYGEIGREIASVAYLQAQCAVQSPPSSMSPGHDVYVDIPPEQSVRHRARVRHVDTSTAYEGPGPCGWAGFANITGLDYDDLEDTESGGELQITNHEAGLRTGVTESTVRKWRKQSGGTALDFVKARLSNGPSTL